MNVEAKIILNLQGATEEILMKKRFIVKLEENAWIKTQHNAHEITLSKEVDITEFENEHLPEIPIRQYFKKILRTHYSSESIFQAFYQKTYPNVRLVEFNICTCELHISD